MDTLVGQYGRFVAIAIVETSFTVHKINMLCIMVPYICILLSRIAYTICLCRVFYFKSSNWVVGDAF